MSRKLLWSFAGVVIALSIAGGVIAVKLSQFKAMGAAGEQMTMPPEIVNVLPVQQQQRQPRLAAVGSVMAMNGTEVSTESDGVVRAIYFEPGTTVHQGDALLQLDIDIEQAQLRSAEAAAQSAHLALNRVQELRKSSSVSQADIDIAISNDKQAQSQVEYMRAVIGKKTVRAPFSGKLGIRRISEGQFLPKGSPVVSLQSLSPIFVEFSLPQQQLSQLSDGLSIDVTSDVYPAHTFKGAISAISPQIDLATRNVRVQATLTNRDGQLRPGMFVSVSVILGKAESTLMIPATAVLHGSSGDTVFVIDESSKESKNDSYKIVQKEVRLGEPQGDFVSVISGLNNGERVISTGVFKLRNGSTVVIDQRLAPPFQLAPSPDNT